MTTKKTRTTATDLLPLVWDVLKKAKKGRGQYAFLTAYQILAELPREVTAKLIEEYGPAAGGVGNRFGAAGPVAAAGVMLERQKNKDVEITFLDTRGMHIDIPVQGEPVEPAGPTLGLYRLKKK